MPSRIFERLLPPPRPAPLSGASSRPSARGWPPRGARGRLTPGDLAARRRGDATRHQLQGRKLSFGAAAGAPWEGRAERAASRSLLSALIGPAAGTPGRREGGRKVGTRSPAPSATRPAQPGLDRGGGETESDAGGRAGGARPLGREAPPVLLRARRPDSSAHDATSNPGHPGGRLSLERTPAPHPVYADIPPPPPRSPPGLRFPVLSFSAFSLALLAADG